MRRPVVRMPLFNGLGEAIRIESFGPLPVTRSGYIYILHVTKFWSRRAAIYSNIAARFTAVGTADILVNDVIPKWGCRKSLLSDNGRQ